jgi:hypothetical protein
MKLVDRKDVKEGGTTGRCLQETALRSDNVGELEGRKWRQSNFKQARSSWGGTLASNSSKVVISSIGCIAIRFLF